MMFRRFLILLLIALLPLQGIASSFMLKCDAMSSGATATMSLGEMPCHEHGDDGAPAIQLVDQGCCQHLAAAIPPTVSLSAATQVQGLAFPAVASSFTDHLPDRLQRPPLNLAI